MGDHAWGNPEIRGIEGKNALDVGKHEAVIIVGRVGQQGCCIRILGCFRFGLARRQFRHEGGNEGIRGDPEEGVSGNDAAHGMANQDSSNGRVDGGRRRGGRDFDINHDILKPEWKEQVLR